MNKSFYNLIFLFLFKHKSKHLSIFFISIILIFILSSVMFISGSIKSQIKHSIENQSELIVQKIDGGKISSIPISWTDDFSEIYGIESIQGRVYGKYWFEPYKTYFNIVGVDFFEEHSNASIKKIIGNIDLREFVSDDYILVGNAVKKALHEKRYKKSYDFRLENKKILTAKIYGELPNNTNTFTNDMIIMDISLAKKILNISEDFVSSFAVNIPNELEIANIKNQLIFKHSNIKVTSKDELLKEYENLFNFKGGIFLILYIVCLLTFVLILYERFTMVNSSDKKEIGILKSIGFSIKDILKLKIYENLFIGICAFLIGVVLAYAFVFILNAPILSEIFMGHKNLASQFNFIPNVEISLIISLFFFYILPFIASILIPVWKIAVIDAVDSMR